MVVDFLPMRGRHMGEREIQNTFQYTSISRFMQVSIPLTRHPNQSFGFQRKKSHIRPTRPFGSTCQASIQLDSVGLVGSLARQTALMVGVISLYIYIYIYKENFILYKYRNNFLKNNIYFNINDIIKFKNNYINYKSIKIVKNLITQLAPFLCFHKKKKKFRVQILHP